jgi:hypothetical protein
MPMIPPPPAKRDGPFMLAFKVGLGFFAASWISTIAVFVVAGLLLTSCCVVSSMLMKAAPTPPATPAPIRTPARTR